MPDFLNRLAEDKEFSRAEKNLFPPCALRGGFYFWFNLGIIKGKLSGKYDKKNK